MSLNVYGDVTIEHISEQPDGYIRASVTYPGSQVKAVFLGKCALGAKFLKRGDVIRITNGTLQVGYHAKWDGSSRWRVEFFINGFELLE